MEKIIYLEADEEITSVIDRVKNAQSQAVALVVPRGASVIQGIVNLKLLRREADKIKKEVFLVTTDKAAKNLAMQVGISVFDKLDDAISAMPEMDEEATEPEIETSAIGSKVSNEKSIPISEIKYRKATYRKVHEVKPQPQAPVSNFQSLKPSFKFNWKYALGIFIFLILAGLFTAFFLLPKAEVTLTLNSETLANQFRITVDKNQKSFSPEDNAIPGQIVTATKDLSQESQATGKKDVGEAAKGSITIYNSWSSSSQNFAAGTKFRSSSGKVYISTSAVTCPGATVSGGKLVASSATIQAVAQEKGAEYNGKVGKITILGISTTQQANLYGVGSNFSGGFTKEIVVVSKDDITKAKKELDKKINLALSAEIADKVSSDNNYSPEAVSKEIIKEEISPKEGEEAKDFEIKTQVKISTLSYKKSDFDKIVDQNIQKNLEGRTLIADASKEIITKVAKQDLKEGKLTLDLDVKAQVGPELDEKILRENLSGKSQEEAIAYLKGFKEVKDVQVTLWPFWVKKIPGLEASLKIEIDYVAQEEQNQTETGKELSQNISSIKAAAQPPAQRSLWLGETDSGPEA
jgi:hypothetical protein